MVQGRIKDSDEVAFEAVTVIVELPPAVIEDGLDVMFTVGAVGPLPPPLPTVMFTVVYAAPPHLSHSSTTVCSGPAAIASDVFSEAPFTEYFRALLT